MNGTEGVVMFIFMIYDEYACCLVCNKWEYLTYSYHKKKYIKNKNV